MTWRTRNVCDLYPPGSWPGTLAPYCGSKLGPIDWSAHPWPDDPVYGMPKTRAEILGLPPANAEQETPVAGLGTLGAMDPRTPRYVDYSNLNARFDASVMSGLGGGSLGGNSLGAVPPQASAGLGEIPWQCWDTPGFKACHGAQWEAARNMCDPNFGGSPGEFPSVSDCINVMSGALTENECVPQYCPETSPGGEVITGTIVALPSDYPWMVENEGTRGLQQELNFLIGKYELEYCVIGEDGKLGPTTCGLAKHMNENTEVPTIVPETCEAFATPAMCRADEPPAAEPPPAPPITFAKPPERGISKASMWAIGGVVAALVIGGGYYLTKRGAS